MSRHTLGPMISTAAILTLAGAAFGQSALGGGRALDGGLNTNPGGRINASAQDLQGIVRFNTSAGNALNGPGYTGRTGPSSAYNAPFPGSVADAINRGLIRDAGILSRYAPSTPRGEALGSLSVNRFDRVAAIEAGVLQGALTSSVTLPQGTSATDFMRNNDQGVGYTRDRNGDVYMARSSVLRGLSVEQSVTPEVYNGIGDAPKTGTAATYSRVIDELRRAALARALENPNRVDISATPPAAAPKAVTPVAEPKPTTIDPGSPTTPNTANTAPNAAPASKPVQYDPSATLKRLRERLAPPDAKPTGGDDGRARKTDTVTTADPSNGPATSTLTEEDINALRSMGLKLETLVPPGATDAQAADGYTRAGQEALTTGRFGLADQMFESALTRERSNVLAAAGRAHATLGLGLLMSGGDMLRQHMVDHPEMIPVRYNETLLMPRPRAERLAAMLIADIDREGGPMLTNGGLTLAYLGRQFDNAAWLNKGLTAMAAQTKDDPQGTELHSLLTKVWSTAPTAPSSKPEPSK
jgi:hypothetical protein